MAGGSDYITDAVWWLWTWCEANIAGARLAGIYANKSGYHNTVNSNKKSYPGNYSIRLSADLTEPANVARGFDLTLGPDEMIRLTGYLQRAALHPDDDRLNAMREFYGTLDGWSVYGLINSGPGTAWAFGSSDSSHLWHIHFSFFTSTVDVLAAMQAIASVLAGVTWEQWRAGEVPGTGEGEESDVLTAIQTKDVNGDTIILLPWMHGYVRIPVAAVPGGALQNAIDALTLAGVRYDNTSWVGPYDFSRPDIGYSWGYEIKGFSAGSAGPAGPPGAKGDPGAPGEKGEPGQDGIGVGSPVTITGTVVES